MRMPLYDESLKISGGIRTHTLDFIGVPIYPIELQVDFYSNRT